MELQKQVCSLDLAERLKELGVKQESLFCWMKPDPMHKDKYDLWKVQEAYMGVWYLERPQVIGLVWCLESFSAFTVAELGEMLPPGIESFKGNKAHFLNKKHETWWCQAMPYSEMGTKMNDPKNLYQSTYFGSTEADARAKMLVYLLENKLATV